jgi:hypothetical protein
MFFRLPSAILLVALGFTSFTAEVPVAHAQAQPRFHISFSKDARSEPVTGMVYVAISRDTRRSPIEQVSPTGVPLFSKYVEALAPGAIVTLDDADLGYPVASLRDLPSGEYWMQAFVNVYTKFSRADGKTVWLHMDQGEGQDWKRSPGNIAGDPTKVKYDPQSSTPITLVATRALPAIQPPADTDLVKRIRIQSPILTRWWGRPMYLGATVLLPKDYDKHPDVKYPVNYVEGHFWSGAPASFGRGGDIDKLWLADDAPRFLYVTLQHPSPYYDDSYGVNSENNGPYGDAIIQELIPAVERQFRAIAQPWARLLSGSSTGGWIAVAHQVFYPDFYGGSFASCPDAVDFSYHQIVDIYKDANAYYLDRGWFKVERPSERQPDGNIKIMMKDENRYELVLGDRSRSGGQWDAWESVYSPVGSDGYPKRIWNKQTGEIDKTVAEAWKKYDIHDILRTNWATLGPKVAHKLNIYVGDMDSYYLNDAVEKLSEFLQKAENPRYLGEIKFQRRAPHCWGPWDQELLGKMTAHIEKYAPTGADLTSWRYR